MNLWYPTSGNVSGALIAPNDSLQSVRSSSHPISASREEFSWGLKKEEQRNQPLFNSLLNIIAFGEPQVRGQEWPRGVRPPWRKNGPITDLSSTFCLLYPEFTPWSLWLHTCFTIPAILCWLCLDTFHCVPVSRRVLNYGFSTDSTEIPIHLEWAWAQASVDFFECFKWLLCSCRVELNCCIEGLN